MPLVLPNTITNDTPADAAEVEQNFTTIEAHTNANLIHRDGSVAMTGPLLLPGDPTQTNHAANKGYVDAHGQGPESARPTAVNPQRYFATDTKRDWLYDGTGWIIMAEPPQTITPSILNITIGNGTNVFTYHRSDGFCDFYWRVRLGLSGAAMGIGPSVILPFAVGEEYPHFSWQCILTEPGVNNYRASHSQLLVGQNTVQAIATSGPASTGKEAGATITSTIPFNWTANGTIYLMGRYRMQTRYTT